jgi:hypothetical protein
VKNKKKIRICPALPSANTRQTCVQNACMVTLPSAVLALGKLTQTLPSADTRQRIICRVPARSALGKVIFLKKIKKTLPSACQVSTRQSEFLKKIKKIFAECLPGQHSANTPSGNGCRQALPNAEMTLGKGFAECPTLGTRQRNLCRLILCRVVFAECGTRQRLCRVRKCLCRVLPALGKVTDPCSV